MRSCADHLEANKPKSQAVVHEFMALVWGGVTDDPNQDDFTVVQYPQTPNQPPSTQILDGNIGQVVAAMPPDVAANTIIIFTSDHGEYAGAHGLVSGKTGSFYDECVRVPLIVADPTGRFTRDTDIVRTGLTSSVDFLPMIVTLGYNGRHSWLTGDLAEVYGSHHRHDMLPMLRSANAHGRRYVLFTTDESMPPTYNFLEAPAHIVGIRTETGKFAFYCFWQSGTTDMVLDDTVDREYYDYETPEGAAEVHSTPDDPRARKRYDQLVKDLIPRELRAPLPKSMRASQARAHAQLVDYLNFLDGVSDDEWRAGAGISILGYGLNVA